VCRKTFSARDGTVFFRRRVAEDIMTLVLTLIAHGFPIAAIVAAFGFQARTVRQWVQAAGQHSEQVHTHLVVQPRDLGQVQADEIRGKVQGGVLWLAMALMVSTRLWLGGVVSAQRDTSLIRRLVKILRACALPRPLLLAVDGLSTYVKAFRQAFRTPQRTGQKGRPRLIPWAGMVIGQVIKRYERRRIREVVRRLVQGGQEALEHLVVVTQGRGVLNTAYIERLNATFPARLAALARRTRGLLRCQPLMHAGMYLVGTVYNFCTFHASLTHDVRRCTPAMAAGITDHSWSVGELLRYRVPPPPWKPPRRRGRPSTAFQRLVAQLVT